MSFEEAMDAIARGVEVLGIATPRPGPGSSPRPCRARLGRGSRGAKLYFGMHSVTTEPSGTPLSDSSGFLTYGNDPSGLATAPVSLDPHTCRP
jgi:hypothetical protein